MDIVAALKAFFDDQAGQLAIAMLVVAFVSFVLGVAAAIRDKTFSWEAVDAFLRSNIAGKVFPIWVLLFAGYFTQSLEVAGLPLILAGGSAAALAYVASTVASIVNDWQPGHAVKDVPTS